MFGPWGWNNMMRGPGYFGGGLLGGGLALLSCLVFLVIVALVVWLIVRLARSAGTRPAQTAPPPPPATQSDVVLETLRRRLAEGAITPEEFDQLREKLGV